MLYVELAQRKKLHPVLQPEFVFSRPYCTVLLYMFFKPFVNYSGQLSKNPPLSQSKASFSPANANEVCSGKKLV